MNSVKNSITDLFSDLCVFYLENTQPFADADGSLHFGQIQRIFKNDDNIWFQVLKLTDHKGNQLITSETVLIPEYRIVSNRPFHDINPKVFYAVNEKSPSNLGLRASSFVKKNITDYPLTKTTRSGFGSGIYGLYISNQEVVNKLSSNQTEIYEIDGSNCYPLQDKEHGISLVIASLTTNQYLDEFISVVKPNISTNTNVDNLKSIISEEIQKNPPINLTNLWNIVFYRTGHQINQEITNDVLERYIIEYFSPTKLFDSLSDEHLIELPINLMLQELGFTGLIATDTYNNGWTRGCVSFSYDQADILEGNIAPYQKGLPA